MVNRKTILKQLEHIHFAKWPSLKDFDIDRGIGFCESALKSRKTGSRYAATKIQYALDLIIYQLWGVPSTKLAMEKVFAIALEAGEEFTCKPVVAPSSSCPNDRFWLPQMTSLMVIASLQEDDSELARCSNWFKVEEYSFGEEYEIAFQTILYQVANIFRDRKFRSFEKLETFLELCRVKEPPLLMSALEGILSSNSNKTFENLITSALDHAKRTNLLLPKGQVINERFVVALYQSLLWNVAELRGLQPPTMPLEIRPFMLTRQTLGLPPIQAIETPDASKSKAPKTTRAKTTKAVKTAKAKSDKAKSVKTPKAPTTVNAKTVNAKTAKTSRAKNRK